MKPEYIKLIADKTVSTSKTIGNTFLGIFDFPTFLALIKEIIKDIKPKIIIAIPLIKLIYKFTLNTFT